MPSAVFDFASSAQPPAKGVVWYTGQFYALFYLQNNSGK